MGMLKDLAAQEPVVVPTPQEPVVVPTPAPVISKVPSEPKRDTDLEFKRDPGTRLIKSVVGYNKAGEKMTFEFERDGRRRLEKIKVR